MATTDQLHNFCGRKNSWSEIIKILQSHAAGYGDFNVLQKFKMAAMDELKHFLISLVISLKNDHHKSTFKIFVTSK